MGALSDQGIIGIIAAVAGVAAGIFVSRLIKRYRGDTTQRKRDATPPTYASRQEMRKAEREKAKKESR